MLDHHYEELRKEGSKQLHEDLSGTGRPTPLTLIADKYTPNRRTLDIVGANVYLNGSLETLYLDGQVVQDHTGRGIAKGIFAAAQKMYGDDTWKQR